MGIFICREFIADVLSHDDKGFAQRALSKAFDRTGHFIDKAKDDHRHDGVTDGWIRYISTGNTAFRLIFFRRGSDVYLYRAGEHSVSDHLKGPKSTDDAIEISGKPEGVTDQVFAVGQINDRFFKTTEPRHYKSLFADRYTVPHSALTLVSPEISFPLVSPVGLVGKMMDAVLYSGGSVTMITQPPREAKHLSEYDRLAARNIEVLFHSTVNARLSLFEVDVSALGQQRREFTNLAIVGSAQLTEDSFGSKHNDFVVDDLSYQVSEHDFDDALAYCMRLTEQSQSLPTFRGLMNSKLKERK